MLTKTDFAKWWQEAIQAGLKAGGAITPTPMVVQQHRNMLDDGSPVVKQWHVPEGVCGFAWVNIKPGNCAFANWLKAQGLGKTDSYAGGVTVWISEYNQSYTRKAAHAAAMAQVLAAHGIKAYSHARLD